MTDEKRRIYSVTELTRLIRNALEREFGNIWIEGELSNVRRPVSGHYYLTIKDGGSQVSGVLFRGDQRTLTFQPTDGQKVRVFGGVSVYERSGNYQVIIRQMEEVGKGSLQEQFEQLKEKLRKEGLFDAGRKRRLPVLPQHIGVVTSATGAAIRDILNVVTRRFPNLHVLLWPVNVQGEGAADDIAAAVRGFGRRGGVDVLIVGRGGGSLEDLWCFNEEVVARAIAECPIPVISAVGHEVDFTISDFVADVRAPTPSAAAELVVGTKEAFEETIAVVSRRLLQSLRHRLAQDRGRFERAAGHYVFREPANVVARSRQILESCRMRMRHELQRRARGASQRADDLNLRLSHGAIMRRESCRGRLDVLASQLRALDPHGVLKRGYTITRTSTGGIVRTVGDASIEDRLVTTLSDGELESEVVHIRIAGDDA